MEADAPYRRRDIFKEIFPDEFSTVGDPAAFQASVPLLSLVFAPGSPVSAYLRSGGSGVYKNTDGGLNWTQSGFWGLTVRDLEVSPLNPSTIFAATSAASSVWRSTEGGSDWTNLSLPNGSAYSQVMPASSPEHLYAGTSEGVYKYAGYWLSSSLASQSVRALAVHPAFPKVIYAGTVNGVYVSFDGGLSWQPGSTALEGRWIESIYLDLNNADVIYFTTRYHRVLWLSP